MRLPFLNREAELGRLSSALDDDDDALLCLYGRRRCGKSRLLRQLAAGRLAAYYVGDERTGPLQRADLAREMARVVPGLDAVQYPDWTPLFDRWWREAPPAALLVLDEFPAMVSVSPELPSVLQKRVDQPGPHPRKLLLCGSSQRMMLGLLLDGSAPLYGRARELLKIEPLAPRWLRAALALDSAVTTVQHYAVWGGVPRYWELAARFPNRRTAVRRLLLDPMGVLHTEPERLLLDDMRDITRAASILALIGRGAHRLSEIAGRLQQQATALSRPIGRLVELGLVARETPFGEPARQSKKSRYHIADPLMRFWYRFVEPNRSRLMAGHLDSVEDEVDIAWPAFLGDAWEALVRERLPHVEVDGTRHGPASRWWGKSRDGRPIELDAIAEAPDGSVLVVECKRRVKPGDADRLLKRLHEKARACPPLRGRDVRCVLWSMYPTDAPDVLDAGAVVQ